MSTLQIHTFLHFLIFLTIWILVHLLNDSQKPSSFQISNNRYPVPGFSKKSLFQNRIDRLEEFENVVGDEISSLKKDLDQYGLDQYNLDRYNSITINSVADEKVESEVTTISNLLTTSSTLSTSSNIITSTISSTTTKPRKTTLKTTTEKSDPSSYCPKQPDTTRLKNIPIPKFKLDANKYLIPLLLWGPSNQLVGFRESVALAIILNRTLILPKMYRHYVDPASGTTEWHDAIDPGMKLSITHLQKLLPVVYISELHKICPDQKDIAILPAREIDFQTPRFHLRYIVRLAYICS